MYDNKVRLSPDVIEKAHLIAQEWGLKNARAAVEAVFRKYADDYLQGFSGAEKSAIAGMTFTAIVKQQVAHRSTQPAGCEALNELDDLLGL
jgi:hypothetical protein